MNNDKKYCRPEKRRKNLSSYIKRQIPNDASIEYILSGDFNNDGADEAVVVLSLYFPYPPVPMLIYVWVDEKSQEYKHQTVYLADKSEDAEYCILDNLISADVDGDGVAEIVFTMAETGNTYVKIYIIDWIDGEPCLVWQSKQGLPHGCIDVSDTDNDGIYEIISEWSTARGAEIISFEDACYHIRESCCYKWEDGTFACKPWQVRSPYGSYNMCVNFLAAIFNQKYEEIYRQVIVPGFLGLNGLDDCSLKSFVKHMETNVRPILLKNLSKGKLLPSEPFEDYCFFSGPFNNFILELAKKDGVYKVQRMSIT
jgi:hypothetical protein